MANAEERASVRRDEFLVIALQGIE
jgi:hypothetical protein